MRSPLRFSSSSYRDLVASASMLPLILLAGCGGGDGIVLPGEGEPAAISVVDGDGQQGRVGEPLNEPVVVQVTDSRGRPVEGATVAFDFSSAGAGAAVVPQEKITDGDGLADARLVLGTSIGLQTGQARVVLEGRGPMLATFSATALPENANRMAAVAGQDQTGHVGLPLDDRLVVEVTDGFGNPVAGVPISWVAVGGGSVSEAVVPTGEDGRSRVDRILGPTVGEQATEASAEGLAGSPVTFVHTALAGDASRLVIISGNDQIAEPGTVLPAELVVRLIDADGNGVPQTAVSWVVATGGGAASPENTTTDSDGRSSARWTLGGTLGQQRLDAVVSGVGIASFHATATAVAPPSLFVRTQPSASASAGVPLARQPVVQLRDSRGNNLAQAGVQVTAAIGSGGGELGGTRQVGTDASGQATFTNLSISGAPGRRTLIFTASGYAPATSSEIEVGAVATTTTITGDSPDPSAVGATIPVQVLVTSEGPAPNGTVTIAESGGPNCTARLAGGVATCSLTLNTAGDRTLTATYSGAPGQLGSSDTEPHRVVSTEPPPPAGTVTTITGDNPDPTVSGSTFTVSFRVASNGGTPTGNVTVTASGGTGASTCSSSLNEGNGSCQLTLNTVGERTLTASYSGAPGFSPSSDTEPHTVNPVPPSNEPPFADFNWHCEGLTCNFTDASRDDDGNETIAGRRWDFGDGTIVLNELNPSHTYSSEGKYKVTLTVTDNGGLTDDASDNVDPEAPPPPNQAPTAAFTSDCDELECKFESQSRDGDGRIEDYDWTFGDGGTSDDDDPDHEYSAGGTYQVTLTVTDNDGAESSVTHPVTVAPEAPPANNPPTAAFPAPSCTVGEPCQFIGESTDGDGIIQSRVWEFQDATPSSSTDPRPIVTFTSEGSKTVTLTVTDDDGATDSETKQVTVAAAPPSNTAPTANDDAYSTPTETPLSAPPGSLTTNDSPPEAGDIYSTTLASSSTTPGGGQVSVESDGSFSYTPAAGFTGQDTFSYTLSDGRGGSDNATVTLSVGP